MYTYLQLRCKVTVRDQVGSANCAAKERTQAQILIIVKFAAAYRDAIAEIDKRKLEKSRKTTNVQEALSACKSTCGSPYKGR